MADPQKKKQLLEGELQLLEGEFDCAVDSDSELLVDADAGTILMTEENQEPGLEILPTDLGENFRVGSILDHGASHPISSDSVTETIEDFTLSSPEFTFKLPGKIAKSLNSDQREGLEWLWSLHWKGGNGFFGNMGFGKTLQMCIFIAGLFHSNLTRRVLIVAPERLLTRWKNELSTVGLSERMMQFERMTQLQDKGVLLTTFDVDTKSLLGDDVAEDDMTWDYVILDEVHLIQETQRTNCFTEIPCDHRIIISSAHRNNLNGENPLPIELMVNIFKLVPGNITNGSFFCLSKLYYKDLRRLAKVEFEKYSVNLHKVFKAICQLLRHMTEDETVWQTYHQLMIDEVVKGDALNKLYDSVSLISCFTKNEEQWDWKRDTLTRFFSEVEKALARSVEYELE